MYNSFAGKIRAVVFLYCFTVFSASASDRSDLPLISKGIGHESIRAPSDIESIEICDALAEVASYLSIQENFILAESVFLYTHEECNEPLFLYQARILRVILSEGRDGLSTMEEAIELMDDAEVKAAFVEELELLRDRYRH
jgi:hypothetical protein